jgi:hypothetical protein
MWPQSSTNYLTLSGPVRHASLKGWQGINKNQEGFLPGLDFLLPVLATSSDSLQAVAILIVAIGLAGLAILILFAKKKI